MPPPYGPTRLYVGHISPEARIIDLEDRFSRYGVRVSLACLLLLPDPDLTPLCSPLPSAWLMSA